MDDLMFLRGEFAAGEETFLGRLRPDFVWDKPAFSRLEQAMRRVCAEFECREELPRWLVDGFWCCAAWVKDWTGHPDFPRPEPVEYYEKAMERFQDLQYWFVMGESPHQPGAAWEEL
ncbi:hypothetical protein [Actinocorallia sp. A-T 12471]|uniref:hypothetical protein n=1 Tax=Actinocorallia sp. A-T 12471 TaxID=3089813 RepID=UPI0029D01B53|nr:hypothetical protein [Actinocorallia sp. A-T 12471]MDX6742924.1 hypothetical protein [Actinocorallia sp. A-T 12471]